MRDRASVGAQWASVREGAQCESGSVRVSRPCASGNTLREWVRESASVSAPCASVSARVR